ncbi:UbiD family decarboxylase [Microbacterium murale]|uniref:2,5-furandicarboxylate decarboxylase 1 n=1 Tax=Microbacterium murale TaxID=1081040 RepID=A0ABU0PCA8_9MICO|nr:UbiD family decarboxylase [Microbacterium murale]MDQ0644968.1 2,5-furandicarboxylate decarboxylase 1 [Microbacterium murale]
MTSPALAPGSSPVLSSHQDAHAFLAAYHDAHPEDVLDITAEVPADEGVTGLIYELAADRRAEMLWCHDVAGVDVPVIGNVFASRTRIARMLGVEPTALHEEYHRRASNPLPMQLLDDGPIFDVIVSGNDVDLAAVPALTHFASDRAPYITSGIIIGEDPDSGVGNMSYHRSMVHSRNELATSLHSRGDLWRMLRRYSDRGQAMPVAMVIGGHPLFMLAASSRIGYNEDEREVAGGLLGEPLQVVRTPKHGIKVPAWAEFVLEGTISADAYAEEGPFGEFSGYSSNRSTNNVLRVDTVLRRRDAILVDVEGGNTAEHLNLARIPREAEMAQKVKERFPDVVALQYPTSGTHFHCYVSLRQQRPGAARQVMLGLLGWDPYVKTVIAVDEDIDITDDSEVLWALATHFQPHRDMFTVGGLPGSPLDPSSGSDGTTSRLALDATRGADFHGERIVISDEARSRARILLDSLTDSTTSHHDSTSTEGSR